MMAPFILLGPVHKKRYHVHQHGARRVKGEPSFPRRMVTSLLFGKDVCIREAKHMPTEKKVQTVVELRDQIARSTIAIGAEYRGLTGAEMVQLRRQMRQAGIELRVVKNTLFRRAAEAAGKPHLAELVQGPTAIVFGYSDVITPARAI